MRGIRIHDPQCSHDVLEHDARPPLDHANQPLGMRNDGTCSHNLPWYQRSYYLTDRSLIATQAAAGVCRFQAPN